MVTPDAPPYCRYDIDAVGSISQIAPQNPTMTSLPEPLSTRFSASSIHPQPQSPFFATLYPELRNLIFSLALAEYDDPTRPYVKHEFYYRPGFEFAGKIDTNLLLTCRLVYLETHLVPVAQNEHVFWMHRAPPERKFASDHNAYFARMTPEQRGAVQHVRFFTQMFWLEGRRGQKWAEGLTVPKLTITLRHSDWTSWETGAPLHIDGPADRWGRWISTVPGLQELELELETVETKKEQHVERVRDALGWKFLMTSEHSLVHDGAAPTHATWLGSSRMSPGIQKQRRAQALIGNRRRQDPAATLDDIFPFDLKLDVRTLKFVLKFTGSSYQPVYLPPAPSLPPPPVPPASTRPPTTGTRPAVANRLARIFRPKS
ncbi:hypothetical protein DFH07DRAFT_847687 [Mycena maculata]|uniref:Uncharacterized protein n=1 Tax=Mycena maculata TaxID=230809 RepID=A0AAD7HYM2_9AGAR|nr:hypothetical protein DFH07DRAFT_847687 [Mycena maculata]